MNEVDKAILRIQLGAGTKEDRRIVLIYQACRFGMKLACTLVFVGLAALVVKAVL